VEALNNGAIVKVILTYFAVAFAILLSANIFQMKVDVPIIFSIVLLVPLYIWYKKYASQEKISDEISEREKETVIFWIFALFTLALLVRVPSALLFGMPYEKTPLIYIVVLTITVIEKTRISACGFKTRNFGKALCYGLGFYAIWGGITLLSLYIMVFAFTDQPPASSFDTLVFLSAMPFQTLCVGISEEGFFRGYTQTHLEKIFSPKIAVLSQAFLFGVWHFVWNLSPFDPFGMAQYIASTFFIGLLFGYFYSKARNLTPLVLAHGLWNSVLQGVIANEAAFNSLQETPLTTQLLTLFLPYAISMSASFLFIKFFVKEI
jgi:membrane protease YdiL (CAAX protease family)